MLRIRKVKTKSGSKAIQVVQYAEYRAKIVKHMGSARDDIESDLGTVKQVHGALNAVNGAMTRLHSKYGDLICDFFVKRYRKELNDLNKLV